MVTLSPAIPHLPGSFFTSMGKPQALPMNRLTGGDTFQSQEKLRFSSKAKAPAPNTQSKSSETAGDQLKLKDLGKKFKAMRAASAAKKLKEKEDKQQELTNKLTEKLHIIQKLREGIVDYTRSGTTDADLESKLKQLTNKQWTERNKARSSNLKLGTYSEEWAPAKELFNRLDSPMTYPLPTVDEIVANPKVTKSVLKKLTAIVPLPGKIDKDASLKGISDPEQLLDNFYQRLRVAYIEHLHPARDIIQSIIRDYCPGKRWTPEFRENQRKYRHTVRKADARREKQNQLDKEKRILKLNERLRTAELKLKAVREQIAELQRPATLNSSARAKPKSIAVLRQIAEKRAELQKQAKLNSDTIAELQKQAALNLNTIAKLQKQGKLNSNTIAELQKQATLNSNV